MEVFREVSGHIVRKSFQLFHPLEVKNTDTPFTRNARTTMADEGEGNLSTRARLSSISTARMSPPFQLPAICLLQSQWERWARQSRVPVAA